MTGAQLFASISFVNWLLHNKCVPADIVHHVVLSFRETFPSLKTQCYVDTKMLDGGLGTLSYDRGNYMLDYAPWCHIPCEVTT